MTNIIDYLDEDPIMDKQKWACLMFLSKKNGVICAGIFETYDDALKKYNELQKKEQNKMFDIAICENGKWIPYLPNDRKLDKSKEELEHDSELLNILIGITKKKIDKETEKYNERNQNLILNKEKLEDAPLVDTKQVSILDNENPVKLDINEIEGQKYICYSFCSPIDSNGNKLIETDIYGIKTRCVFNTKEEADKYCEKLSQTDKYFDIYVGKVGKMHSYDINTKMVLEQKYKNEKLQKLIDKQEELETNIKIKNNDTYEIRRQELLKKLHDRKNKS